MKRLTGRKHLRQGLAENLQMEAQENAVQKDLEHM
jgi:hypothetical protein